MKETTTKTVRALKAHVALNVRSVEASTEFYRRMLGLEPSKVRAGYAKFDVQNPPLNLTLNERRGDAARGALSHMGIQLASTEDVLSVRRKWAEAGLSTRDEMQTNCCYAVQDKTWVTDPDGNEWEAFVVLEDNLAETSMCCVAAAETDVQAGTDTKTGTETQTDAASTCCVVAETGTATHAITEAATQEITQEAAQTTTLPAAQTAAQTTTQEATACCAPSCCETADAPVRVTISR